ncbi:hypothetical protein HHO41_19375 [Bacillus sp. DNRA2]|uniref:GTP pyrophosphokinase n=1 Tax=Bacillus sp. DNRA2 TaxID=2723053 RepID=UPI00145CCF42|nr:hypothetical protein [Bacillus sp. DNRA2]NMD72435.1 hypothetical protein [Bacillus sp. DNRA2]
MDTLITNPIIDEYKVSKELYKDFCTKIEGLIKDILKQKNLNYHSIESRVKEENSLDLKVKNSNGKYTCLGEITDVTGLRIITYFSDDVDMIAEIIQKEFEIDKSNSVDKRKQLDPDRFGYLSLHYVVKLNGNRVTLPEYQRFKDLKVEIQIRSILQHAWAEIEHDLGYKTKHSIPSLVRREFSRLAGLLELADEEFIKIRKNLDEYNENIKEQIKSKPSNVLIDKLTIKQLLEDRESIASVIDYEICKIANAERQHPDDKVVEADVQRLKYLGLNTIDDVINSLYKHKKAILRFAHVLLKDNEDHYLLPGLSLFYLAYSIIGSKGSVEDINDYLNEFTIGELGDREDFVNQILALIN